MYYTSKIVVKKIFGQYGNAPNVGAGPLLPEAGKAIHLFGMLIIDQGPLACRFAIANYSHTRVATIFPNCLSNQKRLSTCGGCRLR